MKRLTMPTLPTLELSWFGLGVAAVAVGAAVRHAFLSPAAAARRKETIVIPSVGYRSSDAVSASDGALADDPFFPGRTPPTTRYRLAAAEAAVATHRDRSAPIVLGTVIGADGSSFAICRLDTEPPRSVRLGGNIGGYRLTAVERGRAMFLTPEGRALAIASSTSGRPAVAPPSPPVHAGHPLNEVLNGLGQHAADTLADQD